MAASWSKSTLLRRMEAEFVEATGESLINEYGVPSKAAQDMSLSDFAGYIARQIVVESMTGRKAQPVPRATTIIASDDGEE